MPAPTEPQTLYTLREAAAFLRVSIRTLGKITGAGEIATVRVRGQVRISGAALDEYVRMATAYAHGLAPDPGTTPDPGARSEAQDPEPAGGRAHTPPVASAGEPVPGEFIEPRDSSKSSL